MNSLKSILILTAMLFVSSISFSQKKVIETSLKVDGVCGMCKERIEAALDTVGVKYAEWDLDTKILKIAYKTDKYTIEDISNILAQVGHDTETIKATDEAYSMVDACCKYRDPEVVEDHKN